jgi:hypothetical protein
MISQRVKVTKKLAALVLTILGRLGNNSGPNNSSEISYSNINDRCNLNPRIIILPPSATGTTVKREENSSTVEKRVFGPNMPSQVLGV